MRARLLAAALKRVVFRPAGVVALDGGHGPAVGGVGQPSVRGMLDGAAPRNFDSVTQQHIGENSASGASTIPPQQPESTKY